MNKSALDLLKEYRDIVSEASDDSVSRVTCCKCGRNTSAFNCSKCGHKICTSCKDAPPNKKKVSEKIAVEKDRKYTCVKCGADTTGDVRKGNYSMYCAKCDPPKKKVSEASKAEFISRSAEVAKRSKGKESTWHASDECAGCGKRLKDLNKPFCAKCEKEDVKEGFDFDRGYCIWCEKRLPKNWDSDLCAKCLKKEEEKKKTKKVSEELDPVADFNQYTGRNFLRPDTKDIDKTFKIDEHHVLRVIFYDPPRGGVKVRFKLSYLSDGDESPAPEYKDFTDIATARIYAGSAWGIDIFKLTESWNRESPVYNAIMNRLERAHSDVFEKYGYDIVENIVDDVAGFVGNVDEIGSSDVSIWTKRVLDELSRDQAGAI